MTLFDKKSLQNLLQRNWTSFIDKNKLMAFILTYVRDADLPKGKDITPHKGMLLTISRISLLDKGILLWIDFRVPTNNKIKIGTCEAILSYDGVIQLTDLVGQTLDNSDATVI